MITEKLTMIQLRSATLLTSIVNLFGQTIVGIGIRQRREFFEFAVVWVSGNSIRRRLAFLFAFLSPFVA